MAPTLWGVIAVLLGGSLAAAQPVNDDCASATVIGSSPFTDEVDTSLATLEGAEPAAQGCTIAGNSIWYRVTAGGSDVNLGHRLGVSP